MDLGHSQTGNVDVIVLPIHRLDSDNAPEFKAALASLDLAGGPLVADMSQVEFVDSMGIGALLGSMRRQHEKGTTIRLCCLQPRLGAIFEILKLHRVFEIYETLPEAVSG